MMDRENKRDIRLIFFPDRLMPFYKYSTETHNLANTNSLGWYITPSTHVHTITSSLASNDAKHEPMVS